jgi:two-component system nitrogen regulation response regulator GlnG
VRVIAATHQDLEKRVKEGGFREDLFHRLNVIRLRLPALRERHEDVPVLTRHFLQQSARQLGVEPKRIADSAIARLEQFAFPGNVRQLENICHWLTVMAPAQVISLQDLPPEVLEAPVHPPAQRAAAAATEPAAQQLQPSAGAPLLAHAGPVVAAPAERVGGLHPPVAPAIATASVAPGMAPWPVDPEVAAAAAVAPAAATAGHGWEQALETEAQKLLAGGQPEVWDALTRRFESRLIRTALIATHGRRMEAAQRLGIGRNTITRKIQELGLDAPDEG